MEWLQCIVSECYALGAVFVAVQVFERQVVYYIGPYVRPKIIV